MKNWIAIAFIVLLSAQCIFKLGIITFFEANRDFIAEVLCVNKEKPMTMCNGQCFLDRNLSFAEEETNAQTSVSVKYETTVFITYAFEISLLSKCSSSQKTNGKPAPAYHFDDVRDVFHPPC